MVADAPFKAGFATPGPNIVARRNTYRLASEMAYVGIGTTAPVSMLDLKTARDLPLGRCKGRIARNGRVSLAPRNWRPLTRWLADCRPVPCSCPKLLED